MLIDGNTTTVINDLDASISEQGHLDPGAVSGHGFIDGVVYDFPNQVV